MKHKKIFEDEFHLDGIDEIAKKIGVMIPMHSAFCLALEGNLGAGKSTLAKAILKNLKIIQSAEGSPTFALAHEYLIEPSVHTKNHEIRPVIHMDFYRIKNEAEIEQAGIEAFFWERKNPILICEWLSLFPRFEQSVFKTITSMQLRIDTLSDLSKIDSRKICASKIS